MGNHSWVGIMVIWMDDNHDPNPSSRQFRTRVRPELRYLLPYHLHTFQEVPNNARNSLHLHIFRVTLRTKGFCECCRNSRNFGWNSICLQQSGNCLSSWQAWDRARGIRKMSQVTGYPENALPQCNSIEFSVSPEFHLILHRHKHSTISYMICMQIPSHSYKHAHTHTHRTHTPHHNISLFTILSSRNLIEFPSLIVWMRLFRTWLNHRSHTPHSNGICSS